MCGGDLISRMGRHGKQRALLLAVLSTCSILSGVAHGGEPLMKMASSIMHGGGTAHAATTPLRLPANRLDLAPPALPPSYNEKIAESFPAAKPHSEAAIESQAKLAGLGNSIGNQRVPGRVEQLARNFHRDGLPVARIFQSENSLVHLGLNQKGKPGLWIVEKIH